MDNYLYGIDVSHHNGIIQWDKVAADASMPQFVYLKATEGGTLVDSKYAANRKGAKAQQLLCGAYHFFVPSTPVPDQVANFCNTVASVKGELLPMLDVEQAGLAQPDYAAAVMQWLQQVYNNLGYMPGIYTNAGFWNNNVGSFLPFKDYPLWIAHYTTFPSPKLPPSANYRFWQYTDGAKVNGISGNVDMSRFPGTLEQLNALICGALT